MVKMTVAMSVTAFIIHRHREQIEVLPQDKGHKDRGEIINLPGAQGIIG
jgi:hypothetical protein